MAANDAIVERALEAIRALNRGKRAWEQSNATHAAQPLLRAVRGVCFHCDEVQGAATASRVNRQESL